VAAEERTHRGIALDSAEQVVFLGGQHGGAPDRSSMGIKLAL
jgi:hypothetical protein